MIHGSANYVFLVGDVVTDPLQPNPSHKVKTTAFRLATSRKHRHPVTKQMMENVDIHNIVCFNETVDAALDVVVKGRAVCVVGQLQYYKPKTGGLICQVKANTVTVIAHASPYETTSEY